MSENILVYCKVENMISQIINNLYKNNIKYPIQVEVLNKKYIVSHNNIKEIESFNKEIVYEITKNAFEEQIESLLTILRQFSDIVFFNEEGHILIDMSETIGFFKSCEYLYSYIHQLVYKHTGFYLGIGIGYNPSSAKYAYDSGIGIIYDKSQLVIDLINDKINYIDVSIPKIIHKSLFFEKYLLTIDEMYSVFEELCFNLSDDLISYEFKAKEIEIRMESIHTCYKRNCKIESGIYRRNDLMRYIEDMINEIHCKGYLDHPYKKVEICLKELEDVKGSLNNKTNEIFTSLIKNKVSNLKFLKKNIFINRHRTLTAKSH